MLSDQLNENLYVPKDAMRNLPNQSFFYNLSSLSLCLSQPSHKTTTITIFSLETSYKVQQDP